MKYLTNYYSAVTMVIVEMMTNITMMMTTMMTTGMMTMTMSDSWQQADGGGTGRDRR